jgi:hypothetical protein
MRLAARNSTLLAGTFGLSLALSAHAEPPAQPAQSVEVTQVAEPAPAEPIEDVPDSDKSARNQEHLERMRTILKSVLMHLEEARDQRDVIKLNCVNEKLVAVKGLLKVSEEADVKMQEALARRDSEAATHEFQIVSLARRKIEQLLAESEACVGELSVYSGDTEVEVIIDEGSQPPPITEPTPIDVIVRPPAASPFE